MAAYLINQMTIQDTSYQAEYYPKVATLLEKHGGKQIVGGTPADNIEGDWELPERVAILEFPNLEHAAAFWNDPDYASVKAARQACTTGRVMLIDGKS